MFICPANGKRMHAGLVKRSVLLLLLYSIHCSLSARWWRRVYSSNIANNYSAETIHARKMALIIPLSINPQSSQCDDEQFHSLLATSLVHMYRATINSATLRPIRWLVMYARCHGTFQCGHFPFLVDPVPSQFIYIFLSFLFCRSF